MQYSKYTIILVAFGAVVLQPFLFAILSISCVLFLVWALHKTSTKLTDLKEQYAKLKIDHNRMKKETYIRDLDNVNARPYQGGYYAER